MEPTENRNKSDLNARSEPPILLDQYSEALLSFFLEPSSNLPQFLLNPPEDFNPNAILDEEFHTPLHWACAMGHLQIMDLLLKAGANISAVNNLGQTALMRSAMFTNNYDLKTFPQIVDALHSTIFMTDSNDQTVFHLTSSMTQSRRKTSAACYYLECMLSKLSKNNPAAQVAFLLNIQDADGDSSLLICARNGARNCAKLLTAFRANPNIMNKKGLKAADFLLEDIGGGTTRLSSSLNIYRENHSSSSLHPPPHVSEAAIRATRVVKSEIESHLTHLASSYDLELLDKKSDNSHALELLEGTRNELNATYATLLKLNGSDNAAADLRQEAVKESKRDADIAVGRLKKIFERSQAKDLAELVRDEESRINKSETELLQESRNNDEQYELAQQLTTLQSKRRILSEKVIELLASSGTGEKMNEFRRLIAMSCGLKLDEVDALVIEAIDDGLSNDGESHWESITY